MSEEKYIVYGSFSSYFTEKVIVALDWSKLPYEFQVKYPFQMQSNANDIETRSGTHLIPVVRTPENWMISDSTPILHLLDSRLGNDKIFFPDGLRGAVVAIMEEFFDEWTTRTAVHYRWNYDESADFVLPKMVFERTGEHIELTEPQKYNMKDFGRRVNRARGTITKIQKEAAEAEFERIMTALEDSLSKGYRYTLGSRPNAADTTWLGALKAHFYHDPVPKRVVEKYPRVVQWIKNYKEELVSAVEEKPLDPNNLPPFADFLLKEMSKDYKNWILYNHEATQRGDKSLKMKLFGEEVTLKTVQYASKSLENLRDWLARNLKEDERKQFEALLTRYNLLEVFKPQLKVHPKL